MRLYLKFLYLFFIDYLSISLLDVYKNEICQNLFTVPEAILMSETSGIEYIQLPYAHTVILVESVDIYKFIKTIYNRQMYISYSIATFSHN